jgi:hypothetical protein
VFCQHLPFLCFFCSILIYQPRIGGLKGLGLCHHRIEVILYAKCNHLFHDRGFMFLALILFFILFC